MLDKLDVEMPHGVKFNPMFARLWKNPNYAPMFGRQENVGLYQVTGDLRRAGLPLRISLGHKHHPKLGPKVEFIGVGDLVRTQWIEALEEVFDCDGEEAELLRVDLTADARGITVPEAGQSLYCQHKAITQQEYGDGDDQAEEPIRTMNRFAAQTLYYGRKPRQLRIYNKTLHRRLVLLPGIHRKERAAGMRAEELSTFRDIWGYDDWEVVTRFERQMGARETAELKHWQIARLGEIHKLERCDPFEKLRFIHDAKGGLELERIQGPRKGMILTMRDRVANEGLDRARAWLRALYGNGPNDARAYRKFWQENEHLIMQSSSGLTRAALTAEYRKGLGLQLAA